ncbi:DHHC zinc finger domain [Tieghemostelium lacteum]|uniref:Palmitoyltransferase n=1 Tax=Tieghemostelium lacteum TaxID=361077 RepID=A0A152A5C5_TIELA|nr:DHHC zinc finger domain [Tieghemostelium lacteum]|eukprot:KYR01287.1 DHHC zinc finger domain [Tieghemostelium lacteum]
MLYDPLGINNTSGNSLSSGGNNSKFLDKLEVVISAIVRGIGPLFVGFAVVLIGCIAYVHFTVLLPTLKNRYYQEYEYTDSSTIEFLNLLFHYTLSTVLLFNIAFNYIQTIITPPGSPPKDNEYSTQELQYFKSITTIKRSETWNKFCVTCRLPKLERAHHCQLCQSCVLRMDHHCPWVNNCVGLNNHRYFILFLSYLWISCIYVCYLSFPHVFRTKSFIPFTTLMSFVLTLTISIALGGLLFWQLYLILSNQTTIEFLHNRTQIKRAKDKGEIYKNPYNRGFKGNFYEFFRTNHWYLFAMPILSSRNNFIKKFDITETPMLVNNNNNNDDTV